MPRFDAVIDMIGFRYTIPIAEGARRVYETLTTRGLLENSDEVLEDDRILAAWKLAKTLMLEGNRQ